MRRVIVIAALVAALIAGSSATVAHSPGPAGLHPVGPRSISPGVPVDVLASRALPALPHPLVGSSPTIILPNGSVNDPDAPIARSGDTYTLTDNFTGEIVDERNGSTLLGGGYTLTEAYDTWFAIEVVSANDVSVSGFNLANAQTGVFATATDGLVVQNNTMEASSYAVDLENSEHTTVSSNVAPMSQGLYLYAVQQAVLSGNDLSDAQGYAAEIRLSEGITLEHNEMNSSASGIYAEEVRSLQVTANNLSNTEDGLILDQVVAATIGGNAFFDSQYPIDLDGCHQVTESYDAGAFGTTGVNARSSSQLSFDHLRLSNFSDGGLVLEEVSNVSVVASNITGGWWGIQVSYSAGLTVVGINVSNEAGGVSAMDSSQLSFSDVVGYPESIYYPNLPASIEGGYVAFETQYDAGVLIDHANSPGAFAGVQDSQSSNLVVRDSSFVNASGWHGAVDLESDRQVAVLGNNLSGAASQGVYLEYVTTAQVAGNTIRAAQDDAVYAEYCTDLRVANNDLSGAGRGSVDIYATQGFTVVGNSGGWTVNSEADGIYVDQGVAGVVAQNDFSHTGYALDVEGSLSVQVVGNNGSFSDYGIYEDHSVNVSFIGNQLTNDTYGFYLGGGASGWFYHNNFVQDGGWEIDTTSVAGPYYWDNGYPVGGNFWSNHSAPDAEGGEAQNESGADGIVDSPCSMNATNVDRYPLAAPWTTRTITFTESGLAAGTEWTVQVNGATFRSTGPAVVYEQPNAATSPFTYSVPAVSGYTTPTPASGGGSMARVDLQVSVKFSPFTYAVTIEEVGLEAGTHWAIAVGGQTLSSVAPTMSVELANGTYPFAAAPVPGYVLANRTATVTVASSDLTVRVEYVPTTVVTESASGTSGQISVVYVYLLGSVATALALLAVLPWVLRRRKEPPSPARGA